VLTLSNSGLPYPLYCTDRECGQIELPGVPLGSFPGVTYDEVTIPLSRGDLLVFCTDGIFEAMNADDQEFGAARLRDIVHAHRENPAVAESIQARKDLDTNDRTGPGRARRHLESVGD
jgi:sigma-B regulation protein RsbU (phosphoserine phosphatase)